jgi:hypothetical protein
MSKKIIIIILLSNLAALGVGAYVGMKYKESKSPAGLSQADFQNLRDLTPEERRGRLQQLGASAGAGFRGARSGDSGFASGEIISKDDKSITIKLRDGGSKIIFYSDKTEVGKFASGIPSDFRVGGTVTVDGKTNQDGSLTAQSIQIRSSAAPVQ